MQDLVPVLEERGTWERESTGEIGENGGILGVFP